MKADTTYIYQPIITNKKSLNQAHTKITGETLLGRSRDSARAVQEQH